jgi:hypothetical protein
MRQPSTRERLIAVLLAASLVTMAGLAQMSAQVRAGRPALLHAKIPAL